MIADRHDAPHRDEHRRSIARAMDRGRPPRGLHALLSWFLDGWAAEVPLRLHRSGVQWDGPGTIVRGDLTTVTDPGGGSRIGTPRLADAWRRLLDNSPTETDEDGHYVRPMRAALARLAGRGTLAEPSPFMARFLAATAASGGDWIGVASRVGIPPQVAAVYVEEALRRLWLRYEPAPNARRVA